MADGKKTRKITDEQIRLVVNAVCDRYGDFHRERIRPPSKLLDLGPEQLIDLAAHCLRILVRRHGKDLEIPF